MDGVRLYRGTTDVFECVALYAKNGIALLSTITRGGEVISTGVNISKDEVSMEDTLLRLIKNATKNGFVARKSLAAEYDFVKQKPR